MDREYEQMFVNKGSKGINRSVLPSPHGVESYIIYMGDVSRDLQVRRSETLSVRGQTRLAKSAKPRAGSTWPIGSGDWPGPCQ